jgi:hypothetical protein
MSATSSRAGSLLISQGIHESLHHPAAPAWVLQRIAGKLLSAFGQSE